MVRFVGVLLSLCATCALVTARADTSGADSVLARYPLNEDTFQQWKLPDKLDEISGLALSDDGRLLAMNDEQAIVYEIDYEEGRLIKSFAFGERRTLRDDFEGIAWFERRVYLVTSDGTLYVAHEGADGDRVPFETYSTGVGRDCEIEGLATDRAEQELLLLCKRSVPGSDLSRPLIFRWSIRDRTIEWVRRIELPQSAIEDALGSAGLRPSGIAHALPEKHWLIVAVRQRAVIEIDNEGQLVAARTLPLADRHPQPEGIELLADGRLVIADEGRGGRARLTVYRPSRNNSMIER